MGISLQFGFAGVAVLPAAPRGAADAWSEEPDV